MKPVPRNTKPIEYLQQDLIMKERKKKPRANRSRSPSPKNTPKAIAKVKPSSGVRTAKTTSGNKGKKDAPNTAAASGSKKANKKPATVPTTSGDTTESDANKGNKATGKGKGKKATAPKEPKGKKAPAPKVPKTKPPGISKGKKTPTTTTAPKTPSPTPRTTRSTSKKSKTGSTSYNNLGSNIPAGYTTPQAPTPDVLTPTRSRHGSDNTSPSQNITVNVTYPNNVIIPASAVNDVRNESLAGRIGVTTTTITDTNSGAQVTQQLQTRAPIAQMIPAIGADIQASADALI